MTPRWTRRRALQAIVAVAPLLAGCTVSGSVQQQQEQALANATATPTAGPTASAAGTPGATPSGSPGPLPTFTPGGNMALRFGVAGSPAELAAYDAAATAYGKATPHVTVTVDRQSAANASTLAAALAAKTAPDVITVSGDTLARWSAQGALDNLTALLGANKLDLSGTYSQLQDFATVDGVTIAVPVSYNPRVLYVNSDLFEAAGVPAPGDSFTWAAFEAAASHISQGSSRSGFVTGTDPFDWLPWVWAAGGSVFDDDLSPTKCTLSDAPSVSGLQRFADLWLQHRGAAAPAATGSTPLAVFVGGKAGMLAGDRATLASLKPAPFKWQVTYLPQGPGGHATTYAATLAAVSKSSRQPLAAGNFAGYLATDKTAQTLLAKTGVVVPALRVAAESPDFKFTGANIDDAVFTRTLLFSYQPPRTAAWSQVQAAWMPDLQKLWAGQQSAADAAKALVTKVNAALTGVAATPTVAPFAVQPPTPTATPVPTATAAPGPTAPTQTATPAGHTGG